jgi:hypothetical protein
VALSDDIETLKAAIYSGTKRVKYRDREVEYNSVDDMLRVLGKMTASNQTTKPVLNIVAPAMDKGI